jgi:hypothetical protein
VLLYNITDRSLFCVFGILEILKSGHSLVTINQWLNIPHFSMKEALLGNPDGEHIKLITK